MRAILVVAASCLSLGLASEALAQYPPPQPGGYPPPGGGYPPNNGYPPPGGGYAQPGPYYGQPPPGGYGQQPNWGNNYRPIQPEYKPPPPECCFLSVRINPLDLFFQRMPLEAELALWGPISIEVDGSYIFGVPGSKSDGYTAKGYGLGAKAGVWFEGQALRGWFGKAVIDYSSYTLNATSGIDGTSFGEVAYGILLGNQTVFGRDGGFTLSGGIGIKYIPGATEHDFIVNSDPVFLFPTCDGSGGTSHQQQLCLQRSKIAFLGQLAIGWTF